MYTRTKLLLTHDITWTWMRLDKNLHSYSIIHKHSFMREGVECRSNYQVILKRILVNKNKMREKKLPVAQETSSVSRTIFPVVGCVEACSMVATRWQGNTVMRQGGSKGLFQSPSRLMILPNLRMWGEVTVGLELDESVSTVMKRKKKRLTTPIVLFSPCALLPPAHFFIITYINNEKTPVSYLLVERKKLQKIHLDPWTVVVTRRHGEMVMHGWRRVTSFKPGNQDRIRLETKNQVPR